MSHDPKLRTTGTRSRISSETLAGDNRSPAGFAASLLLHGAIVAGTLFTFSHRLEISDQAPPVVPVDLVTIAPKTNVRATVRPQPHIAPEPTPPVPKVMPPPTPPQPGEEKPKEAAEPVAEAPSKPMPRHQPRPLAEKKEEKKTFDVDKVLALLNKVAPSQQAAAPKAPAAVRNIRGIGAQTAMTADLEDALRSQIERCWSPPVGAPHPERLAVSFHLYFNPDGSVAQPPQLTGDSASAASRDPFVQAAAEAARRAIYTCAPYRLPADRYEEWRDTTFNFDPKDMLGE